MKLIEQNKIAKMLGISNNSFHRIAEISNLKFKIIKNKRHYNWDDVLRAIQRGK